MGGGNYYVREGALLRDTMGGENYCTGSEKGTLIPFSNDQGGGNVRGTNMLVGKGEGANMKQCK